MTTTAATSPALDSFMYALKSKESRRTYPQKLGRFFVFCGYLSGSLEEQAQTFVQMAKQKGLKWVQESILRYLAKEKERVYDRKLAPGTLQTYFYSVKLFCDMNEEELGTAEIKWKRLPEDYPNHAVTRMIELQLWKKYKS